MDNELGGADGQGTSLVVHLQVVFSQQDSVGATSVLSQRKNENQTDVLYLFSLITKVTCFYFIRTASIAVVLCSCTDIKQGYK